MEKLVLDKTNTEILIRPICSSDERRLQCFYEGLSDETIRSFYRNSIDKKVLTQKGKIAQECRSDPDTHLRYVAIFDDEIIGLGILILFSQGKEGKEYEIGHLISDEFQGRGIGSFLMEEMLARIKDSLTKGIVVAHTAPHNHKADRLLRKFDFSLHPGDFDENIWIRKIQ